MPRILAPTLAEHRDRRRAALLAAARDLALSAGADGVTMAAVARRTGLSRPAVYEYFDSGEDLLAAVLLDEMRRWTATVTAAVARGRTPAGRVRAYVRASLRLTAEGGHDLAAAVEGRRLPATVRADLARLHRTLATPLTEAVAQLGVRDPELGTQLLQGAVAAAVRRVQAGAAPAAEIRDAQCFVLAGLGGLAGRPGGPLD